MAQQTAVDWLVYELERCGYFEINDRFPITFEQAKQIERQQIIKAWEYGFNDGWTTRENDYNKNYHKKGTGHGYYDYEFNYKYGVLGNHPNSPNTQNK